MFASLILKNKHYELEGGMGNAVYLADSAIVVD